MAIDWTQLISNIGSNLLDFGGNVLSTATNPNVLGPSLIAAGALTDKEPGEVTQARQFQRNLFTSQNAIPDILTSQIDALSPYYEPEFNRQSKALLDDVQQRFVAGQPQSIVGMGGPETASLRSAAYQDILPQQQAFLANLALGNLGIQTNAAQGILDAAKPDPTAAALANLGTILTMSNLYGNGQGGSQAGGLNLGSLLNGGQTGQTGGNGLLNTIGNLFGGGSSLPAYASTGLAQNVLNTLGLAPSALSAIQALSPAGQAAFSNNLTALGALGKTFGIEGLGAGASGTGTAAGAGAGAGGLGALGTLLSTAGTAAAGGGVGYLLGGLMPNEATGALSGVASGAATGAAIGSIIPGLGTAIGALIGGAAGVIGGFFGAKGAGEAQKRANRLADVNSQVAQARDYADFFMPALEASGVDVNAPIDAETARKIMQATGTLGGETPLYGSQDSGRFSGQEFLSYMTGKSLMDVTADLMERVPNEGDQQGQIAAILGAATLVHAQTNDPSITSLDQIPGMREKFLAVLSKQSGLSDQRRNDVANWAL